MARKKEIVTEDYNKIFPTRLRGLMEEQGKTQQDIAHHLSITRQAVSFYADGQSTPNWENIVKIANFFNVSTDYLLGNDDVKTNNADIKQLVHSIGLTEEAASALASLESPTVIALLDYLLTLPIEVIEKLGNHYIAYLTVKGMHPQIEKAIAKAHGQPVNFDGEVNGLKLPGVLAEDIMDYVGFGLSRSIIQAADCTYLSGNNTFL